MKEQIGAGEMGFKTLATKPDQLSLVPRPYLVGGEN